MFGCLIYEWKIHRLLKKIARQRVTMILKPGDIKVIERAVGHDEETLTLIYTAEMRGWVELLHTAVPTGKIEEIKSFNFKQPLQSKEDYWKLTDSGWAAIQRRHQLALLGIFITLLGLYFAANS
jgi:hypothetical protein